MRILIPARAGSKGWPGKNRSLFSKTAEIIPAGLYDQVDVFTNDGVIKSIGRNYGFNIVPRTEWAAKDESTTKEMMTEYTSHLTGNNTVVMLYVTYPDRAWHDVEQAIRIFGDNDLDSLLCKKEIKTSPYLMMYEEDKNRGRQIIPHNLSRRQDYPPVFELSHYISIINTRCLDDLNNNLYNEDTYFMPISDCRDVDSIWDM